MRSRAKTGLGLGKKSQIPFYRIMTRLDESTAGPRYLRQRAHLRGHGSTSASSSSSQLFPDSIEFSSVIRGPLLFRASHWHAYWWRWTQRREHSQISGDVLNCLSGQINHFCRELVWELPCPPFLTLTLILLLFLAHSRLPGTLVFHVNVYVGFFFFFYQMLKLIDFIANVPAAAVYSLCSPVCPEQC